MLTGIVALGGWMKTRILTSIGIVAVVLLPVLLGGWFLEALGIAIVLAASYEWLHALPNFSKWGYGVMLFVDLWIFALPLSFYYGPLWSLPNLPFAWIAIGFVIIWSLPIFFESFSESDCCAVITYMALMGLAFLCMQSLVFVEHRYLWTLCLATYGSDTGAYFFGRFLGKHKMIPRISPKKTWEGFFGGWLCGFLLSFLLSFFWIKGLNFTINFIICLLAPIAAELGDLCFSTFKRHYNLKDFSEVLPGHGGVLDRIDSLLMNFILFGILIALVP